MVMKMDNEDLQYCISCLEGENSKDVIGILKVLIKDDKADERILPYIESRLTDTRPCLLYLKPTYTFGEIRFLAASALSNYCRILGIRKNITLDNCIVPLTFGDMGLIEEDNNLSIEVSAQDSREEACQLFAHLQKLELLPTQDMNFNT
jgi:hypothetical protein